MSIIKSFSVGNGDMFYIFHDSDNFSIIDCCLGDETKERILKEIEKLWDKKTICRFISTHPDDDHICGLEDLFTQIEIPNFYCVKNSATKDEPTDDFKYYCFLRDDSKTFFLYKGCSRKWMNVSDEIRNRSGISIIWPDTANEGFKKALREANNGESPNNISPIIKYSLENGVTVLWFGDLLSSFMEEIKNSITLPKADIIFAPHHGRESGKLPKEWLKRIDPKIIVIGEADPEDLCDYQGYNTIEQNHTGDITFNCGEQVVDIYVSEKRYSVDFLEDLGRTNELGNYIGSLEL